MDSIPSIHDAYGGFGQKSEIKSSTKLNIQSIKSNIEPNQQSNVQIKISTDNVKMPTDASYSNYPIQIKCPKCSNICMTRMQSELGTASWLWCVLLSPFACAGVSCLCIQSCRDKIHYCTRCGHIVGKKFAKAC